MDRARDKLMRNERAAAIAAERQVDEKLVARVLFNLVLQPFDRVLRSLVTGNTAERNIDGREPWVRGPQVGKQELRFLFELNRQRVPFLLVGLGAAVVQGAPVAARHLDLWFEDSAHPGIGEAIKRTGAAEGRELPPVPDPGTSFSIVGTGLGLLNVVQGNFGLESFSQECAKSLSVALDGMVFVRVLPLDRILTSLRAVGAATQPEAITAVEATIVTIEAEEAWGMAARTMCPYHLAQVLEVGESCAICLNST